ncbi:MAG: xanthine-guanine phosphoribosyltransferase [Methanomassiliicoccales archaeon PtaU1.Bin124]|nr:MAG: xanthine-guanine phosphoribosyltransferase [Methanomassiliicoccales archaeon PtaU1.Bin124]
MEKVESFKCKLVTWEEIAQWTEKVCQSLDRDHNKPTVIIGLTRGGWVPARLLCDHLKVKKLYAVKTEHWGVTANQDGKALLTQELNTSIANENVIIVDDITDTGESLTLALGHIKEHKPKSLKSVTLLHIDHSKIEPDYFAVRVPKEDWTWFIFPWNVHEDLRTLLPKTLYEPKDIAGIQAGFRDQFQIDVSEYMVRDTLANLESDGRVVKKGKNWSKAG